MHCPTPGLADIQDVQALNLEYLNETVPRGRDSAALSESAKQEIARVPFLLFELGSDDPGCWQRVFSGDTDLSDQAQSDQWSAVIASSLGFLWHLCKRDPHAARLFSGMSAEWCAQLASTPLIHLISRVQSSAIRPQPRVNEDHPCWRHLIAAGSTADRLGLRAARMALLHHLLLQPTDRPALRPAACRAARIAAGVAEPKH